MFTANNGDIGSQSVTVTATTITVMFTSNQNANKLDEIYVLGIDARPTDGIIGSEPTRYAYRTSATPGTAVMNGITQFNGSNPYPTATRFMTLTLTPGDFSFGGYMAFTTQPVDVTACDDITATLKTLDCAGNPTTIGLSSSIPVWFSASPTPSNTNLPVVIDVGSGPGNKNGVADLTAYIRNAGTYQLLASSMYPQVTSSPFNVTPCPPSKLVWIVDPIGDKGWMPLAQQPVLELQDEWGNPSYAAGTVSLSLINETDVKDGGEGYDGSAYMTATQPVTINPSTARAVFTDVQIYSSARYFFRLMPSITVSGISTEESIWISFAEPFPVELVSFSAHRRNGMVYLNWRTATESDNYGFEIERAAAEKGPWTTIGFIEGAGISNSPKAYSFADHLQNAASRGELYYRLRQIDRSGAFEYSPVVGVGPGEQNADRLDVMPTVVKDAGQLRLWINQPASVTISIYDVNGSLVSELVSNLALEAGNHVMPLRVEGLRPGPYFLRCTTGALMLLSKFLSL